MLRTLPFTEQFAIGYFTSAAGITIYRGDAYPTAFRGNAFIGDVGGNLVHRKTLVRDGVLMTARRADENTEFVTSTDNWFRPVNFVNAPDGTLYMIDMYRETIEHPFSIPDDIKSHLDLQSGDDRGRIYRLMAPGSPPLSVSRLGGLSSLDLVPKLESENSWQRETAQRLLVERQDRSVAAALEHLARHSPAPLARLHALYTLFGLNSLSDEVLRAALGDPEPRLRAHAVRLCESRLRHSPDLLAAVGRLADDGDPLVRFQLALSLGEAPRNAIVEPIVRLARYVEGDGLLSTAILTSAPDNADAVARRLIGDDKFLHPDAGTALLGELASIVGAQPDSSRVISLLKDIFADQAHPSRQGAMLQAIGQGLSRRGGTLAALLNRQGTDPGLQQAAASLFKNAAAVAGNETKNPADRVTAIRLLAFGPYEQVSGVLNGLLTPQTPPELQSAAVGALASHDNSAVGQQLLASWKSFGPNTRREVIDGLLHSSTRLGDLFDAIEKREVSRSEIERDVKQLLMNHPNTAVRKRARKLFEADLPGDRAKIVAEYRPALARAGDAGRGRTVYERRCATCHRFGTTGHAVGPDLVSVQNKAPADLLIAILDPSREAQPNFVAYTLVTRQGAVYNGLIAAESASGVTLRRAEAKEDHILRSQIEELISTGKSLMPEGLEKDISLDQMADLIAFIKSTAGAAAR
jgi:putative heme-binding domain-containing protein